MKNRALLMVMAMASTCWFDPQSQDYVPRGLGEPITVPRRSRADAAKKERRRVTKAARRKNR